jgi:hypothetical protein
VTGQRHESPYPTNGDPVPWRVYARDREADERSRSEARRELREELHGLREEVSGLRSDVRSLQANDWRQLGISASFRVAGQVVVILAALGGLIFGIVSLAGGG